MSDYLKQWIDKCLTADYPPDGNGYWYKKSSKEDFEREAERLIKYGVPEEVVKITLRNLYLAVCELYGDG